MDPRPIEGGQGQGGRGRQEEEVKQTAEKTFASDSPTTIQRIDGDLVARSKGTGAESRLHLRRKRISILFASFRPFSVHLVSFRVKCFLFPKKLLCSSAFTRCNLLIKTRKSLSSQRSKIYVLNFRKK